MQNQHKFVVFCLLFFVGTLHLYLEVWKTQNSCYQQGILLKHHNKYISIILTSYRCLHKKTTKKHILLCNNFRFKLNHSLNKTIRLQNALPEKNISIHPLFTTPTNSAPLDTHQPGNLLGVMKGTTKTCREHMWEWEICWNLDLK